MGRVTLYEDTSGSLYLHREGDEDVYAHVELIVPYGATFEQDAAELDAGIKEDWPVEKIPYAQLHTQLSDPTLHRVAVWEDGVVRKLAYGGRDADEYLTANQRMHTKSP
jgi:hypothetical protein